MELRVIYNAIDEDNNYIGVTIRRNQDGLGNEKPIEPIDAEWQVFFYAD
jgi:hypothetical protein